MLFSVNSFIIGSDVGEYGPEFGSKLALTDSVTSSLVYCVYPVKKTRESDCRLLGSGKQAHSGGGSAKRVFFFFYTKRAQNGVILVGLGLGPTGLGSKSHKF